MKWIFYFLVVSNLIFLGYIVSSPKQQQYAGSHVKDVGDLKRVSDVELRVRLEFQKQLEAEQHRKLMAQSEEAKQLERLKQQEELERARKLNQTVCRSVGPFAAKADAEDIAGGLATERHIGKIIEDKYIKTLGYWAMLPPAGSKAEAEKLLNTLRDKEVTDIRRMTDGENTNAISLGLFSTEINAKRRVREVELHGFLAIIKAKQEEIIDYWVMFEQKPDFDFPLERVQVNYPEVEIKSCNGIASL